MGNRKDNFTTPTLLVNISKLKERYAHFSKFGIVHYPVKTNDHPKIISMLHDMGCSFEVDSIAHIRTLSELGVKMSNVLFSIPVKSLREINEAIELGVTRFVVDTETEFLKIFNAGKHISLEFMIRLSISGIIGIETDNLNKWGLKIEGAKKLATNIIESNSKLLGFSFYLPQNVYSSENFSKVATAYAHHLSKIDFEVINIGGGLDDSDSGEFLQKVLALKESLGAKLVYLEPGRNLINPSVDILSSVIAKVKRNGDTWLYIDVGIYSGLIDKLINNRYFDIRLFGESNEMPPDRNNKQQYKISGPTSDTLDFIGTYSFNKKVEAGDYLVIKNSGAYSYVFNTTFDKNEYSLEIISDEIGD